MNFLKELKHTILFFLALLSNILLLSCGTAKHNKSSVEAAMKKYDNLILKLDADSISLLFTPDGNLGNMATGRDSIRKFLLSFKNIKVLSQSSTTDSIKISGDSAMQYGKYNQSDIIADKDTIHVKGEYTAKWQWIKKQGWHIKLMETKATKKK